MFTKIISMMETILYATNNSYTYIGNFKFELKLHFIHLHILVGILQYVHVELTFVSFEARVFHLQII